MGRIRVRVVALLFFGCLVISLLRAPAAYAFSGSGTALNPYKITTCAQLQEINNNLAASYPITNNIDCGHFSELGRKQLV